MTVEELANKRYSGEFVFMLGHLEVNLMWRMKWRKSDWDHHLILHMMVLHGLGLLTK